MEVLKNDPEGQNGIDRTARNDVGKASSPPKDNENHAIPPMPLGFQGLLKTSTETGDIGLFSIKPPRVPHHPAALPILPSPRRRKIFPFPERLPEHYSSFHPIIDDRRRLPSYSLTPAATSDTVSLFDGASQISTPSSRRLLNDNERASSMTTSSYSPFGISSNHNSYTSLRSQPELITQRSRSPYLYPARLKRPGFRPSSPLLSDAGVDYSRRAEIERVMVPPIAPYMSNGRSMSPASFHARKRAPPPLSIRTDINRSNPSPRKPCSPARNQNWHNSTGNEDSFRDTARYNGNGNGNRNVSPARSNHSSASTVNQYRSCPPGSTTTTPGRAHPPSPLYYDYTEEFETEEFSEPTRDDVLPPFHLEKTIHEDRPLSTGWDSLIEASKVKGSQPHFNPGRSIRSSVGEVVLQNLRTIDHISAPGNEISNPQRPYSVTSCAGDSIVNLVRMYEKENNEEDSDEDDTPKRSFPLKFRPNAQKVGCPTMTELTAEPVSTNSSSDPLAEFDLTGDSLTDRTSDYSLSSNLPLNFPKPPTPLPPLPLRVNKVQEHGDGLHLNKKLPGKPPDESTFILDPRTRAATSLAQNRARGESGCKHKRSASTQSGHYRSSKVLSLDPGLSDLAQLISTFEAAKARGDFGWSVNSNDLMLKSPACNTTQSVKHEGNQQGRDQRALKAYRSENNLSVQSSGCDRNGYLGPHKFTHVELQATTNSSTPMFAPKPISPARVAKLKTTVPQLMKSLPALPKQGSLRAISPPAINDADGPPFRFSRLMKPNPAPAQLDSSPIVEPPIEPRLPPKLKLRLKRSELTIKPTPSETSRPWNVEENYPWNLEEPIFPLDSASKAQESKPTKIPRFKLKVSRPSDSAETIHVNRSTGEERGSLGIENPRDLFTPPSRQYGIHALFSIVGRHFSNPKKSNIVKSASMDNVALGARRDAASSDRGSSLDLGIPQLTIPMPTFEARSFFSDDSSQIQAGQSLRRRITNFRARLPTPYASRSSTMGSRSYDDIIYRQQSLGAATKLGRSDFMVASESASNDRVNGECNRHRLRSRLTGWFGRAKSLMTGYMRPRNQGSRDQVNSNNDG